MKKWFGKSVIPTFGLESDIDILLTIGSMEKLKEIGFLYDGETNKFSIGSLQETVFLEKNITNTIEKDSTTPSKITLKEDLESGFYPKYKIPNIINEKLYWNNKKLQEYNYFFIRGVDITGYTPNVPDYQYIITYSDAILDFLMSNNFVGVRCEYDFGLLKKDVNIICDFSIEYNKDIRDVIAMKILNIDTEEAS